MLTLGSGPAQHRSPLAPGLIACDQLDPLLLTYVKLGAMPDRNQSARPRQYKRPEEAQDRLNDNLQRAFRTPNDGLFTSLLRVVDEADTESRRDCLLWVDFGI